MINVHLYKYVCFTLEAVLYTLMIYVEEMSIFYLNSEILTITTEEATAPVWSITSFPSKMIIIETIQNEVLFIKPVIMKTCLFFR